MLFPASSLLKCFTGTMLVNVNSSNGDRIVTNYHTHTHTYTSSCVIRMNPDETDNHTVRNKTRHPCRVTVMSHESCHMIRMPFDGIDNEPMRTKNQMSVFDATYAYITDGSSYSEPFTKLSYSKKHPTIFYFSKRKKKTPTQNGPSFRCCQVTTG